MRQKHRETCAALAHTRRTAHANRAAKPMHDPTGYPQAKSSPSLSFGGKEWFKNTCGMMSCDSTTTVCERKPNPSEGRILAPVQRLPGTHNDTAVLRSSFHSVEQQG